MKSNDRKTFMRSVRLELKLTQPQMAQLLGVSAGLIQSIEIDRLALTPAMRARVALLQECKEEARELRIARLVDAYREELEGRL